MKKYLISFCLFALTPNVYSSEKITLGDKELQLDTVYHTLLGPGVTRTGLHISGSQPLDVYYITVDLNTPGLSFRGTIPKTENGLEKTSEMAKYLTGTTSIAVAGVNGDFFDVNSTYPDGSPRKRMPTYTTIIDNNIFKTSPQGNQFTVDINGTPRITTMSISSGSVRSGDNSVALGGVNVESINYSGDAAPDNAVTVYTPRGWKSPFQTQFAGQCAEVTAMPVDGSALQGAIPFLCRVTSTPSSTGNLSIPTGSVVLLGRGTGKTFIESLSEGDLVEINCDFNLKDGSNIVPALAIGGNPRTVASGVGLESDGTRPDAVELHPRTGIGISADRKKVYMMVVDGRGASVGVTTHQLGDLLAYAGAAEGLNFDGGGSSTCWTLPFGVVNSCSDKAGERAVGNALYVVAEGNYKDKEIAQIRFEDFRKEIARFSCWTPRIIAYNSAGFIVDTDLKGCSFSSPSSLGEITSDGEFCASGSGHGLLTAEYNGLKATVRVDVRLMTKKNLAENFSLWSATGFSVKNPTVATSGEGLTVNYTMGSSTGSAKITVNGRQALPESAEILRLRVKPVTASIPKLTVNLKASNSSTVTAVNFEDFPVSRERFIDLNLKKIMNTSEEGSLPVEFVSLIIIPGDNAKAEGRIEIQEISALSPDSSGVNEILRETLDSESNDNWEWYTMTGLKVRDNSLKPGIYIRKRGTETKKILIH